MSMLYARCVHTSNDVSAADLCGKGVATGKFVCMSCEMPVTLVRPGWSVAHFRHSPGSSCLVGVRGGTNRMDVARARVDNRMSEFHTTWQSLFLRECLERRHGGEGCPVHVADIELGEGTDTLVIEIQHSHIVPSDLISRERTYPRVKWVFDCSNINFKLVGTKIAGIITTELVMCHASPSLHGGIKELIIAHQLGILPREPEMYLDSGDDTLYLVENPGGCMLNQQRLQVKQVARNGFLRALGYKYGANIGSWPRPIPQRLSIPLLDWDLVNVRAPIKETFIGGLISIPTFTPFVQFKIFLRRLIDRSFLTTIRFGKHKNVPLYAIPSSYRHFLMNKNISSVVKDDTRSFLEDAGDGLTLVREVFKVSENKRDFVLLADINQWGKENGMSKTKLQDRLPRMGAIKNDQCCIDGLVQKDIKHKASVILSMIHGTSAIISGVSGS
eukprot:gene9266-16417_t